MKGYSFENLDSFNSIDYFLTHIRHRDTWIRNTSNPTWQSQGHEMFMALVDHLDEKLTVLEVREFWESIIQRGDRVIL